MSESTIRQRIGIFGGTFDPVHLGHLLIAELAREQLNLSQVYFVPAAVAPHKLNKSLTEAKHRVEMLGLAIGGNSQFVLDQRELIRGGTSYTIDTLCEFKAEFPQADLVFIMGADSLADLHTWREPTRICELAFVAVLARGGETKPDLQQLRRFLPKDQIENAAQHLVPFPQIEISSTEIRQRVKAGKSIRYQVAAAVGAYIASAKLYVN